MNVHFISLGCPKNRVDSEIMLGRLLKAGHTITSDASEADCVVVNTCSFIGPAVNESIDTTLEMARWKALHRGRKLIVVGCLPERYGADLAKALPEVDVFLGTGAFDRIVGAAQGDLDRTRIVLPQPGSAGVRDEGADRYVTTPPHRAYLKIAEGCSEQCTYCIIPKLRGRYTSRPVEEVLSEARMLANQGVKELTLVAQNTTAYGLDLGRGFGLDRLLEELAEIPELRWIRLLYGHPEYMTDAIVETIGTHDKICSYFDIPIQHVSDAVLRRMGRRHNGSDILRLFQSIRRRVPGAALRTTLMVGFPGEKEEDFQLMLDLVERIRFDHLGAFMYSNGDDLPSGGLRNHVPETMKQKRFDRVMMQQAEVSRERIRQYLGKTIEVLVEGRAEEVQGRQVARAAFQAPEIDGVVYIDGEEAGPGSFVNVKITGVSEYDLVGTRV